MEILDEVCEKGVIERRFNLIVDGETVPGIHWLPERVTAPRPTVLIGHGGTQHKRVPNVLGLARKLVRHGEYGVVALDAPGHGDRMTEEQKRERAELLDRRSGDRLAPLSDGRIRAMSGVAPQATAEWRALLDDLSSNPQWGQGPFGYWGVSMGTAFGVPLLASEPRIVAGVLGLGSLREGNDEFREQAARITVPLLFLFQWDDELPFGMPSESERKLRISIPGRMWESHSSSEMRPLPSTNVI